MARKVSAAGAPPARTVFTPRLILISVLAVVVVVVVVAILVVKLQSSPALNLTGKWTAQQGPATVDLTLAGTSTDLTGTFVARNAPIPISGTATARVTGTTANVTVNALGSLHTGTCAVSNTKMVCTGRAGDTTLTLTFIRP